MDNKNLFKLNYLIFYTFIWHVFRCSNFQNICLPPQNGFILKLVLALINYRKRRKIATLKRNGCLETSCICVTPPVGVRLLASV